MPLAKYLGVPTRELDLFKKAKELRYSGAISIGKYIYDNGHPTTNSLGPKVYENYRIATQERSVDGIAWLESRMGTLNKRVR